MHDSLCEGRMKSFIPVFAFYYCCLIIPMAKPTKPSRQQRAESGSEISLTSDIGTITVSSWPGTTAGAPGEHLLVVMDTRELTDNLNI